MLILQIDQFVCPVLFLQVCLLRVWFLKPQSVFVASQLNGLIMTTLLNGFI